MHSVTIASHPPAISFGLHSLKFSKSRRIAMNGGAFCSKSCSSVGNEGSQTKRDAVIIVDHGSRRQESNLMLNEFVSMFKARTSYEIVEPAHMELAEPSIREAFKLCVQQGAKRIIDIPALAAEAVKDHSGISYIVTAPLGLHESLVDVVNDRINYCLRHVDGDATECSVCAGTGKCRLYQ